MLAKDLSEPSPASLLRLVETLILLSPLSLLHHVPPPLITVPPPLTLPYFESLEVALKRTLPKFHILWKGIPRHIELLICINSHRDLTLPTKILPLYSRFISSAPVPHEAFCFCAY